MVDKKCRLVDWFCLKNQTDESLSGIKIESMKIMETFIPGSSVVTSIMPYYHYSDCFTANLASGEKAPVTSLARFLLNYSPDWMKRLMQLRNILVRPFGLQTGNALGTVISIQKGDKAGFFTVAEVTDEEVVLLGEDKHLSACLSVVLIPGTKYQQVYLITTVKYHNLLGRIYFFFVRPFHVFIIRRMVQRLVEQF